MAKLDAGERAIAVKHGAIEIFVQVLGLALDPSCRKFCFGTEFTG
jgi:hypothetical protein